MIDTLRDLLSFDVVEDLEPRMMREVDAAPIRIQLDGGRGWVVPVGVAVQVQRAHGLGVPESKDVKRVSYQGRKPFVLGVERANVFSAAERHGLHTREQIRWLP